jgi:hypothetical protein
MLRTRTAARAARWPIASPASGSVEMINGGVICARMDNKVLLGSLTHLLVAVEVLNVVEFENRRGFDIRENFEAA